MTVSEIRSLRKIIQGFASGKLVDCTACGIVTSQAWLPRPARLPTYSFVTARRLRTKLRTRPACAS